MKHANQNAIVGILVMLFTSITASAQSVTIEVTHPRPASALAQKLEELSGMPINYEDIRYDNAADIKDVADLVLTPAQRSQAPPGSKVLVPAGGSASVKIAVDPTTQRLVDTLSVTNALSTLISELNDSPTLPGRYRFETYENGFYIFPTQWRSATGTFVSAIPVLTLPVTLNGTEELAWNTLKAVLEQVSEAAGIKVDIGTVPIKAFAISKVALSATREPAYRVLSRLFSAICNGAYVLPGGSKPTMSYNLLFDPKMRYYALNVHFVQNPNSKQEPPVSTTPPVPNPSKFYNIGTKKGE